MKTAAYSRSRDAARAPAAPSSATSTSRPSCSSSLRITSWLTGWSSATSTSGRASASAARGAAPALGGTAGMGPPSDADQRLAQARLADRLGQDGGDAGALAIAGVGEARTSAAAGASPRSRGTARIAPRQLDAVHVAACAGRRARGRRPRRASAAALQQRERAARRRRRGRSACPSRSAGTPGSRGWSRCRRRPARAGPRGRSAAGQRRDLVGRRRRAATSNQNVLPRPGSVSTPIVAAHQLDELAADRQAEAGAAVAARRRGVGLGEGLEEAGRPARARCRCRCRAPRSAARTVVAVALRRLDGDDDLARAR